MLDQKVFGEKLRKHRKNLGMTQEEVAQKIGVSAQAISKWEAGDCLPDCLNLKAISDTYKISVDVLLETESNGEIEAVANKIEQLGTEFVWANANKERYSKNLRQEMGEDLWKMWKSLYFAEVGDRRMQIESKIQGNLRICGHYGMKIWDDDGIACIIKSSLIKKISVSNSLCSEVTAAICSEEGQKLIAILDYEKTISKKQLIQKNITDIHRLNELLLMLTESKIIEFVSDDKVSRHAGYKICGHCGIAAYMILSAMYILGKNNYSVSEYYYNHD